MFEIGTTLRDARIRRDISLQQAEDETKVRIKYIQAMENEDFDIMPGGTYVKGFLRTYAEYLGVDFQLLLDEYNERYGSGDHREHMIQPAKATKVEAAPRSSKSQKNRNYILVAIIAIAIIAVLAYLGVGNSSSSAPPFITTVETTATARTSATATAPAEAAARTVPTQTQSETLSSLVVSSTTTDNWVEVHRGSATGEVVWAGTLAAGESKSFDQTELGAPKVWLTLGSAAGLEVSVNGKPQKVPETVGAVFVITAAGITGQG
ncbi:MAG: helix-turn-helix domain-containing protein [Thermoleophilia bacterium]